MKKVYIKPGCIGCGLCQEIAPDVFHVHNKSEIINDPDLARHAEKIEKAAQQCPVGVIVYEENE